MKHAVMVSVIVPTYNHEQFIRQALDSILVQEIPWNIEILIGDDCSSDATPEILEEYKRNYPDTIRLFLHKEHIGATRNAFELLTCAQGKYLATLEGDDYWCCSEKLRLQVEFLEKNPEFIGCTHHFFIVNEKNEKQEKKLSWINSKREFCLQDYDGITLPGQPSTFVRRNIFLHSAHDYSICYKAHDLIADRILMLIFLCQGKFYCFQEFWSAYRICSNKNGQNATVQVYRKRQSHIRDDFYMVSAMEEYAKKEFGITVKFTGRKQALFLDMLIMFLLKPSPENRKQLGEIYSYIPERRKTLALLPCLMIKKIIYYIKYH